MTKIVCFVGAYGTDESLIQEDKFNEFLRGSGIKGIVTTHAGIQPALEGHDLEKTTQEALRQADVIASVLDPNTGSDKITRMAVKDVIGNYGQGKIVYLGNLYEESIVNNTDMYQRLHDMVRDS